jgi:hypothetical protein
MRTREDIESYLMRSGIAYEPIDDADDPTWIVRDHSSGGTILVRLAGPIVFFRSKVLRLEHVKERKLLFRRVLELNASDMVHGSYAIAGDDIVLTCALRLENLDYNEYQGTIDDFSLAFTNHHPVLAAFRIQASE